MATKSPQQLEDATVDLSDSDDAGVENGDVARDLFGAASSSSSSSSSTETPISEKERKQLAKHEEEAHKRLMRERKQMLDDLRREQNKKLAAEESDSKSERLRYLLQQTEIFTHFITAATPQKRGGKGGSRSKEHGRAAAALTASPTGKRGRLEEEAEDEDLLKENEVHSTRVMSSPAFINGTMREYQIQGLNWLIGLYDNGINGILADEMGLGKTLQTISLLGFLKNVRGISGPHLVIVPKSTLSNWLREVNRWCASLKAVVFHGSKEERAEWRKTHLLPGAFDVLITTYEMCIKEKAALGKFTWKYLIIDEAHRIKNENSILSQVVRFFDSQYRLLITGTPLQNNLHELWALLNFLLPEVFASADDFDAWFGLDDQDVDQQSKVIEKLHKVLRPFLLRRLKSEVEANLPPKEETKLYVGLTDMQLDWYKKILNKDLEAVNVGASRTRLLNLAMQLRKCTNHPYLFAGAEPGPPYTTDEHLVHSCGKMLLLDKLLPRLKAQGSRVLIFSQMTRMLDILEDYLVFRHYEYCRIDGQTSYEVRESSLDEFNKPDSTKFVFLLSTRAGGLGINLATADIVILYDSDWNPQMDLQAQDRAHRIGQKKPVFVYRFVTEDSIEERIVARAESKLRLDALVIQQGRLADSADKLKGDELLAMIKFGAQKIFNSRGSTITDEDIDLILARGKQKTQELNEQISAKIQEGTQSLLNFSMGVDDSRSLYEFQGHDYRSKASSVSSGWIAPPKRDRGKGNYSVDAYYGNLFRGGVPGSLAGKKKPPRHPKQPITKDFQFYPVELKALLDQEAEAYRRHLEWSKKHDVHDDDYEERPGVQTPDFGDLSDEQKARKDELLSKGFAAWSRREFQLFCKGCERYGRDQIEAIAAEIGTKSVAEVKEYHAVFFQRYDEVEGWERIMQNIEKGEQKIKRIQDITVLLRRKVEMYTEPLKQMHIVYGTSKGKQYSPEEDVFLIYATHVIGYGRWEELRLEVRLAWQFRFNWFFKSRTPVELGRRVDTLIRLIEREFEEEAAYAVQKRAAAKKSTNSNKKPAAKRPRN